MFDFFVPKNISCVFLISPEKYFAFFETGEGLSIESGEGASHCSTGSREGIGGNFSKLRIPVGSPFRKTRRHQVKAKKEASNGDEEEESWRICYANLTNKSCKFDSQLGRPTAVSIPPPHPPSPVPLNALQCLLPARFHFSQCLQWPIYILAYRFFSHYFCYSNSYSNSAGFSGRLHDGHRRRASARQRSEASNAPGGLKASHHGTTGPAHGGNWKKRCNTFWMLEILFLSISLPCFHSRPWIGVAVVFSLLFLQTLRSVDLLSQHRIVSCFHLDCPGDRESLEEVWSLLTL